MGGGGGGRVKSPSGGDSWSAVRAGGGSCSYVTVVARTPSIRARLSRYPQLPSSPRERDRPTFEVMKCKLVEVVPFKRASFVHVLTGEDHCRQSGEQVAHSMDIGGRKGVAIDNGPGRERIDLGRMLLQVGPSDVEPGAPRARSTAFGPRSALRSRAPAPGHCSAAPCPRRRSRRQKLGWSSPASGMRTPRPWSPRRGPAGRRRPGRVCDRSSAHQRQRPEHARMVEGGDLSQHRTDTDAAEVSRRGAERADERRRVSGEIAQVVRRRLWRHCWL